MKSPIVKRSIVIGGHKTSVSLEDAFWRAMKEIARAERKTLSQLVSEIDKSRVQSNLSSAIRLFVLDRLRVSLANYSAASEARGYSLADGHSRIANGHSRPHEFASRTFPVEPPPA